MLKEEIKRLCTIKGITISRLEKELGFSNYAIAKWDKTTPRIDSVKKVADYFGVSVDSLIDAACDPTKEFEAMEEFTGGNVGERRRDERRINDNDANLILQELTTIIKNYGGEKIGPETKKIPIVSTIKCGQNGIAYENTDSFILIDETLHGNLFALRVRGDSMNGKGIEENDLAIIRQQEELEAGEIGAFLIDGEEATLKRYAVLTTGIALEAANSNYPTRYFINEDVNRVRILGKLVEIRKRF